MNSSDESFGKRICLRGVETKPGHCRTRCARRRVWQPDLIVAFRSSLRTDCSANGEASYCQIYSLDGFGEHLLAFGLGLH
jgi:hypothetical protein